MICSKKFLTSILAASLLFGVAGCKKDAPKSQEEVTQKLQALVDGKWDKSEVNALLPFVPEDSPLVFASTREFDMNHPVIKKLFGMSKTVVDEMDNLLKESIKGIDDESAKFVNQMMSDMKALVSDYSKASKDFGLNPEHCDSIVYVDGRLLVAKLTVDDSAKLRAKIDGYMKQIPTVEVKEVKAGDDTFVEYGVKDKKDVALHINYGKNVATFVLLADLNNTAELARTLKIADKQLLKSKLGKISSDVAAIGFINNESVVEKLLASKEARELVKDAVGGDLAPECDSEIKAIVADYPRLNFVYRIRSDKEFSSDFSLVVKDKDTIKRLDSLHAESIQVVSDKSLMGVKLNIDLAKTLAWVKDVSNKVGEKKYACAQLNKAAEAIKQVPTLLSTPSAAQIVSIVEGISGINFSLDKIDINEVKAGKFDSIQATFDLAGPAVGTVLPGAMMFVASKMPELASLKPNGDAAVTIDLTNSLEIPIKVNAYMTDKDFVVSTTNNDAKSIAKSSRKSNASFLEVSFDSTLYSDLTKLIGDDPETQAAKKLLDAYKFNYTWTIGSNSEGITSTIVSTLK